MTPWLRRKTVTEDSPNPRRRRGAWPYVLTALVLYVFAAFLVQEYQALGWLVAIIASGFMLVAIVAAGVRAGRR
jgi:hypothetical protein